MVTTGGTARDQIVAEAQHWVGTLYDWGGTGTGGRGVDCSGLVIAAYRAAGQAFTGRPIASQLGKMGTAVSLKDALPGDVVYIDEPGATDHVGIYVGNGQMIDSPTQGKRVETIGVGKFTSIRRILPAGIGGGTLPGGATSSGSSGGKLGTGSGSSQQNLTGDSSSLSVTDILGSIFVPGYQADAAILQGPDGETLGQRIGTWIVDAFMMITGAVLIVFALHLVAKGGESARSGGSSGGSSGRSSGSAKTRAGGAAPAPAPRRPSRVAEVRHTAEHTAEAGAVAA